MKTQIGLDYHGSLILTDALYSLQWIWDDYLMKQLCKSSSELRIDGVTNRESYLKISFATKSSGEIV